MCREPFQSEAYIWYAGPTVSRDPPLRRFHRRACPDSGCVFPAIPATTAAPLQSRQVLPQRVPTQLAEPLLACRRRPTDAAGQG